VQTSASVVKSHTVKKEEHNQRVGAAERELRDAEERLKSLQAELETKEGELSAWQFVDRKDRLEKYLTQLEKEEGMLQRLLERSEQLQAPPQPKRIVSSSSSQPQRSIVTPPISGAAQAPVSSPDTTAATPLPVAQPTKQPNQPQPAHTSLGNLDRNLSQSSVPVASRNNPYGYIESANRSYDPDSYATLETGQPTPMYIPEQCADIELALFDFRRAGVHPSQLEVEISKSIIGSLFKVNFKNWHPDSELIGAYNTVGPEKVKVLERFCKANQIKVIWKKSGTSARR